VLIIFPNLFTYGFNHVIMNKYCVTWVQGNLYFYEWIVNFEEVYWQEFNLTLYMFSYIIILVNYLFIYFFVFVHLQLIA
jgi:hypothetical protein